METLPFKSNIDFKNINRISPKNLGIRKKLDIYTAIKDSKNSVILHISQKSRILRKDVDKLEEIYLKILQHLDINSSNKIISIDSPLCSKAKIKLEDLNWMII